MTDLVISEAEAAFHSEHPGYADTAVLDNLRATDFARIDRDGHVYLDYTGGGMFGSSQVAQHIELLESGVSGNPHSINPTSAASSEFVERARAYVLEFFKASPQEYDAIFTPNATGALRLVGEAYPFRPGDRFLLTFDNHNSVNGIRLPAARSEPRSVSFRTSTTSSAAWRSPRGSSMSARFRPTSHRAWAAEKSGVQPASTLGELASYSGIHPVPRPSGSRPSRRRSAIERSRLQVANGDARWLLTPRSREARTT